MCVAYGNIEDHIRNEYFLLQAHTTVDFNGKEMCGAYGNIAHYIRNK
jgi:hypothetical protein